MKAVFLDKDGTLVKDVPYNADPRFVLFESFVFEGLKLLQQEYKLIIISNQAGIAKGKFTTTQLIEYWSGLIGALSDQGVSVAGYYFCPHHPEGSVEEYSINCDCRKPAPGLILQAAREHEINLKDSWMIGDILNDVEAGHRAGCRSILIDNGNETEWADERGRIPDFVVRHFGEAAEHILKKDKQSYETMAGY